MTSEKGREKIDDNGVTCEFISKLFSVGEIEGKVKRSQQELNTERIGVIWGNKVLLIFSS